MRRGRTVRSTQSLSSIVEELNVDAVNVALVSGVLGAIPRAQPLTAARPQAPPPPRHVMVVPRAPGWLVLWRAFRWAVAVARLVLTRIYDRLRGDRSSRKAGQRLRELFEHMGGTAIKLGQQLAVRVDFLPFEVCQELGKLMDAVPPFRYEYAVKRLEALTGKPLGETFAELAPEPIGSASIACVYRGRLHDGRELAIKIRRPGVARAFAADLAIVDAATLVAEILTLVRPGFFRYLRLELREMLLDELDFRKEANYAAMFRRYVKRDRIAWLSAPKMIPELCGDDVISGDFVRGYSCSEILKAVETRDRKALTFLARMDIDPEVIGSQIAEMGMWARKECAFFHSDPHPGNILVLPGNKLVMLDFGACGFTSRKQSEIEIEMTRRLVQGDISGGTALGLNRLEPLPYVDVPALLRSMESAFWEYQIVGLTKEAEWWERTTATLWLRVIEASQEFRLPINLEVLRFVRATLLYDTLAVRLNPKLNTNNVEKRWRREAALRLRLRRKRERRRRKRLNGDDLVVNARVLVENLQRAVFTGTQVTRYLPKQFMAIQSKGAFVGSVIMRTALWVSTLTIAGAMIAGVDAWLFGESTLLWADMAAIAAQPLMQVLLVVLAFTTVSGIRARLHQIDEH